MSPTAMMRARALVLRLPALLALSFLVEGCVMGTQKEGRVIAVNDVARVKVGKTTRQDVLDIFGPPTAFTRGLRTELQPLGVRPPAVAQTPAALEDVYTYEYREENEVFYTIFLLYTSFKRVKLSDTLMFVFDPNDVVKYVAFARQTDAEPEAKK
ncbi:hypothetical protein HY251_04735 [bacterium]|nr:hypothetical protein [bacterium]